MGYWDSCYLNGFIRQATGLSLKDAFPEAEHALQVTDSASLGFFRPAWKASSSIIAKMLQRLRSSNTDPEFKEDAVHFLELILEAVDGVMAQPDIDHYYVLWAD